MRLYLHAKVRKILNRIRKPDSLSLTKFKAIKRVCSRHSDQTKSSDVDPVHEACTNKTRKSYATPKHDYENYFETNFTRNIDIKAVGKLTTTVSRSKDASIARRAEMSKDYLKGKPFDYNRSFREGVEEDNRNLSRYWIMQKVEKSNLFPYAEEQTNGNIKVSVWSGNDYLGMSFHPDVIAAAKDGLNRHGTGSGGGRYITGNSPLHEELEREIADLRQKENALLFSSCYIANDSTLITLGKHLPDIQIFSDAGNHASIIQGILNSRAPKQIYHKNDAKHLRQLLEKCDIGIPKIIAFETVHSMDGTIYPLNEICDISHKYGALTFVDEVHAVGLYGDQGGGTGEMEGCRDKMDIITGTLGKAIGNFGGYVASSANVIGMLRRKAAGFIYTTSLPPAVLAGSLAAIKLLRSEEGRRLRKSYQEKVKYMRKKVIDKGIPVNNCASHMIIIHVGNASLARKLADAMLQNHQMLVQCVHHPVVALGTERLRVSVTPHHTYEMIDNFVDCIEAEWRAAGLDLL